MCKSQFREKLNSLSLAKAFCLKVSGCVIVGVCGLTVIIEPGPVNFPSLLEECPLAPECRLPGGERKHDSSEKTASFLSLSTLNSLTRLFLLDFFSFDGQLVDAIELVESAGPRSAQFGLSEIFSPFPSQFLIDKFSGFSTQLPHTR